MKKRYKKQKPALAASAIGRMTLSMGERFECGDGHHRVFVRLDDLKQLLKIESLAHRQWCSNDSDEYAKASNLLADEIFNFRGSAPSALKE